MNAFLAWLRSLFGSKTPAPVTSAPTPAAPVTVAAPQAPGGTATGAPAASFTGLVTKDREAEYNAWRSAQPANLRAYIPEFSAALFRDTQVANAPAAVPVTGFDLGWTNGNAKINHLYPGSTYSYSLDIPAGYLEPAELTIGITADGGVVGMESWVSNLPDGEGEARQTGQINNTRKHFATGPGRRYLNIRVESVAGPSVQLNHA